MSLLVLICYGAVGGLFHLFARDLLLREERCLSHLRTILELRQKLPLEETLPHEEKYQKKKAELSRRANQIREGRYVLEGGIDALSCILIGCAVGALLK